MFVLGGLLVFRQVIELLGEGSAVVAPLSDVVGAAEGQHVVLGGAEAQVVDNSWDVEVVYCLHLPSLEVDQEEGLVG